MRPEERRMVGKKYGLDNIMDDGKKIPDNGKIAEVTKKPINKVDDIGMDAYSVYTGCNG